MKNSTKTIMAAIQQIAANKIETDEATAIVERLAQCYLGYQETHYDWLQTTKSHSFCVEFSGRLPIVAIHSDLSTAIVLVNQRIMQAFKQPDIDLTGTEQTALECLEVHNHGGEEITEAFLSETDNSDLRTEYAA